MTDLRALELARNALALTEKNASDGEIGKALAPLMEATHCDEETVRSVLQEAVNASSDADALAVFHAARLRRSKALVGDIADFVNAPQPAPVLWRDPAPHEPDDREPDAVLSVGECAILASAGGLGKSTLTLEVASAAGKAAMRNADYGTACGLRVAAGPVMLVNYEDSPPRIAHRLQWMYPGAVPRGVLHIALAPMPLWLAAADRGGESHSGPQWEHLWSVVRDCGVRMVVIDPVSAALADVSTFETGPVRAFLRALTAEAAPADGWHGCGVLLVAHDTKSSRDAIRRGEDPGAGVVAGSAAWYDGARGVLSLMRDPVIESSDRLIECVKANYGRTGWGARLRERTGPGGTFSGLELGVCLARADLGEVRAAAAEAAKEKQRGKAAAAAAAEREALAAL